MRHEGHDTVICGFDYKYDAQRSIVYSSFSQAFFSEVPAAIFIIYRQHFQHGSHRVVAKEWKTYALRY